jgi:hypothetical protein
MQNPPLEEFPRRWAADKLSSLKKKNIVMKILLPVDFTPARYYNNS